MRYLLLLTLSLFSFSTFAGALPDEPYISVTGDASLEVSADQVIISFQASSLNKNAALAKKEVDKKVADLLISLKNAGFDTQLVNSLTQSTRPEYSYENNKRLLLGIRVTHELSYRLVDINKTNQFIDALLAVKIESISPLQYGLQAPQQWQLEVRKMAVLDSQQKATDLAQLYGAKLGKVYSVEYQHRFEQPMQMRALQMESEVIDVKPKNITLTDSVQSVFILKP